MKDDASPSSSARASPVFIMGCRRSGTTLLSQLIGSHSRFAIYHESFLYPIFRPELAWYGDLGVRKNLRWLIRDVREVLATQVDEVPAEERILRAMPSTDFGGLFAALLRLHAEASGKARGGDKTPEHYRFLDDILRDFPSSPVLFVIRDPRDTVHSIRRVFDTSVEGAARIWVSAYESYASRRDEVTRLSYEALVRDPVTSLKRVCSALGEPYEPAMLEFHERVPESFRGRLGGERLASPISPGSIGRYQEMPRQEVALVERLCASGMEELGYRFDGGAPPPRPKSVTNGGSSHGGVGWVVDRLRYYGFNRERWRRGWARWRILLRNRLRYVVTLRFLPGRR